VIRERFRLKRQVASYSSGTSYWLDTHPSSCRAGSCFIHLQPKDDERLWTNPLGINYLCAVCNAGDWRIDYAQYVTWTCEGSICYLQSLYLRRLSAHRERGLLLFYREDMFQRVSEVINPTHKPNTLLSTIQQTGLSIGGVVEYFDHVIPKSQTEVRLPCSISSGLDIAKSRRVQDISMAQRY